MVFLLVFYKASKRLKASDDISRDLRAKKTEKLRHDESKHIVLNCSF